MKNSRKFRAIFWLDASSRNTLYSSIETAAKHLLPDRVFDTPDDMVTSVNKVLSRWTDRWLLVFDNLDNPDDLSGIVSFFPASQCGCILITSRLSGSNELGQSIEMDHMEKEEGLQLLLHDELGAAEEILKLLGNLPLAIDQARAYILRRRLGLREFLVEHEMLGLTWEMRLEPTHSLTATGLLLFQVHRLLPDFYRVAIYFTYGLVVLLIYCCISY